MSAFQAAHAHADHVRDRKNANVLARQLKINVHSIERIPASLAEALKILERDEVATLQAQDDLHLQRNARQPSLEHIQRSIRQITDHRKHFLKTFRLVQRNLRIVHDRVGKLERMLHLLEHGHAAYNQTQTQQIAARIHEEIVQLEKEYRIETAQGRKLKASLNEIVPRINSLDRWLSNQAHRDDHIHDDNLRILLERFDEAEAVFKHVFELNHKTVVQVKAHVEQLIRDLQFEIATLKHS